MELYMPGIYLMMEISKCQIPKSVQNLEDVMRIHQLLMSTKENAISYLEDSYTTPPHQVYSEWLCPTAGTPFKNPNLRITQEVAQI
ncbi:6330_t:CDS:2 [Entrophospora sp. SA101]|nr:22661_t:CDS:2 [Entrophospora sp. SA101]CAJ0892763.1 6330_t:CDS:2 [Entrophospora sp. SA101]